MGLVAPVRGAVHTGGGEGREAQLVLAGGDVLGHLLQVVEALDVVNAVAGLFQQGLIGDQAVAFDNVADAQHLVAVFQGVGVAGQITGDLGAGQVVAVVLPVGQADRAVDLEQGGRIALGHLAHQGGLILAGGGGHDGDRNTGLLGVLLGQILPGFVLLGLEVQVVDLAGCISGRLGRSGSGFSLGFGAGTGRGSSRRGAAAAACQQTRSHSSCQSHRECLFCVHVFSSFSRKTMICKGVDLFRRKRFRFGLIL